MFASCLSTADFGPKSDDMGVSAEAKAPIATLLWPGVGVAGRLSAVEFAVE